FLYLSNAPAPTATYTLSLHDALPISEPKLVRVPIGKGVDAVNLSASTENDHLPLRYLDTFVKNDGTWLFAERKLYVDWTETRPRSEEHTSELQSRFDLVCRLLLEKKK